MSISNVDAIKLVRELRKFCENMECSSCCFADSEDKLCLLRSICPCGQDIKVFVKQANDIEDKKVREGFK